MSVKEHYKNHLAPFYSWMAGDFEQMQKAQEKFFTQHNICPQSTGVAIDLGAGHGIQSVSLAKLGFKVTAVDFSAQLLGELQQKAKGLSIETREDDIRNVSKYASIKPELIVCMGDTITHLESLEEIEELIRDCAGILPVNGKLVFSFRDYSTALNWDERFIPVKSDDHRILTVFLEYLPGYVRATDLLHEKIEGKWKQKTSSYGKVRLPVEMVLVWLRENGMEIIFNEPVNRMITMIAVKIAVSS